MHPERVLEVVHEAATLGCMLLFVWAGGMMMLQYAATADILLLPAGLILMLVGAGVILRAPARYRKRNAAIFAREQVEAELAAREIAAPSIAVSGVRP